MSRPLRIVQIIAGLSVGDLGGGSELFGIRLAEWLRRDGHEVLLCPVWSYDTPTEREWRRGIEAQGIRVVFGAPFRDRIRVDTAAAIAGLLPHIRRFKPDILNTHNEFADTVGVGLHLAGGGRYLVRTGHTELEWTFQPRLGRLMHWLYPFVVSAQVGVSRTIVGMINRQPLMRLSRHKMQYVPNGVDEGVVAGQRTGADLRAALGIAPEVPLFGTVARLSPQKGLPYLVEAMARVQRALPAAQLLVVGKGEKQAELEAQIAELGLGGNITLLGPRRDVIDILAALDVFVLSSLWEGLPTVVLEAMLVGVPVVVTDIPGSRDLVVPGSTGLRAQPRDPESLAAAMLEQYTQRSAAAEMAARARRHAAQFSMRAAAAQYAALYERLVAGDWV